MPESSVVLVQNSPGVCASYYAIHRRLTISVQHTSHSVSSVCTEEVIRQYFQGVIPINGTACEVDDETFPLPGSPSYIADEVVDLSFSMRRR